MKKTYKIILIVILFVELNIFQTNYKVYSYTTDEVKEIINYTAVNETLSEDEYDVKINAEDLIENVKFPVIQASIESVLYDSDNLTDINFLTNNSTNDNSSWKIIQETVVKYYRVCLYIAAIAMITTLIYMAIILIIESYKPSQMPHGARMFRDPNGGNPERKMRREATFEQWIVAIFLIALITVIVNLVVNFTDVFTNIVAGYNLEEGTYVIYVANESTGSGYTFETTIEGLIMFESQYNWSDYAAKNVLFILSGIIITVFKYAVYFLFVVRMFIIAFLVAASPIIILINAFLQISKKKGIFRTWLAIFLFCALIKPIISIVYYIMMANDLILKFPLYILLVVTVEFIAIILSIMMFIRSLRNVNKVEQQEYDEIHGNSNGEVTSARARMYQPQQRGGLTYAEIVEELRVRAGDSRAMSEYLDKAYPQMGVDRQSFVKNIHNIGGLGKVDSDKTGVIEVIKADSMNKWRQEFGIEY